jgi:hypothetical protein
MANGRQQAEKLIAQAGLSVVLEHAHEAVRLMSSAVVELRADERAQALNLNVGDLRSSQVNINVEAARRNAAQALQVLRQQRSSPEYADFVQQFNGARERAEATVQEAATHFKLGLSKAELQAADAQEIFAIWESSAGRLSSDGVEGLFALLEEHLDSFNERVTAEANFGRDPHSPLETWEWILIGVIIGVAVAAVLACIFWGGCSWIAYIFIATFCVTGTVVDPVFSAICAGFAF